MEGAGGDSARGGGGGGRIGDGRKSDEGVEEGGDKGRNGVAFMPKHERDEEVKERMFRSPPPNG